MNSIVRDRRNPISIGKLLFLLGLPSLLTGCGMNLSVLEAGHSLGEPFSWFSQYWFWSLIWALPVPVLYGMGANGRYEYETVTDYGYDQYGNSIVIQRRQRTGRYIEGKEESGIWLAGMWLLLFPLGLLLYPWYAPIWQSAEYASFTPYPNFNRHLIKWVFPLLAAGIAGGLIRYVIAHKRVGTNAIKAAKLLMWLGIAHAAAWPAYLVLDYMFERGEPVTMSAPEVPAKPLPAQPKDLKIPKNGEFDPYATQLWTCKVGFVQVGDVCQKK